jgi:hypothetical protein
MHRTFLQTCCYPRHPLLSGVDSLHSINPHPYKPHSMLLAENFWQQPGKVDALKAAVSVYGQSWTKIKESCPELQLLQASQLKDKVCVRPCK